jgi:hypothetical protein
MAGRGAGKTRAGAEWVKELVETGAAGRIALVGPTAADVRDIMCEGLAGIRRSQYCSELLPSQKTDDVVLLERRHRDCRALFRKLLLQFGDRRARISEITNGRPQFRLTRVLTARIAEIFVER